MNSLNCRGWSVYNHPVRVRHHLLQRICDFELRLTSLSYATAPKSGVHTLRAVADLEFFERELKVRDFAAGDLCLDGLLEATLITESYEKCLAVFNDLISSLACAPREKRAKRLDYLNARKARSLSSSERFGALKNRFPEGEPISTLSARPPTNPPHDSLFTHNQVSQRVKGTCSNCGTTILFGSLAEHVKRCAARS